eukprot:gene43875-54514_t
MAFEQNANRRIALQPLGLVAQRRLILGIDIILVETKEDAVGRNAVQEVLLLTAGSGAVNQNRLVNADKAEGQGFELDLQAIISDEWRATIGGSYNDTEIKDAGLFVSPCGNGCTVTNPTQTVGGGTIAVWLCGFTLNFMTLLGLSL